MMDHERTTRTERPDSVNDLQGFKKLFFIGPKWQIELVRQQYGDSIDYFEQKPIPTIKAER